MRHEQTHTPPPSPPCCWLCWPLFTLSFWHPMPNLALSCFSAMITALILSVATGTRRSTRRTWMLERSFAWMARFRRPGRDYKRLPQIFASLTVWPSSPYARLALPAKCMRRSRILLLNPSWKDGFSNQCGKFLSSLINSAGIDL